MDRRDSVLSGAGRGGLETLTGSACLVLAPRECTFRRDSATTGSWAAKARREGSSASAECYSPSVFRPARGLRNPYPPPGETLHVGGNFDWRGLLAVLVDRCRRSCGAPSSTLRVCGESWLPIRPVLKHGPRSLTCARVIGLYET